jgi:excisionase family DNA binding protein
VIKYGKQWILKYQEAHKSIIMKIETDEIYTTKEVAELLKISLPTVKRMLKDGRLPSIRIGKQHRFLGSDLIQIIFVQRGIPDIEVSTAQKADDDTKEFL